jgi:hypothetical protein
MTNMAFKDERREAITPEMAERKALFEEYERRFGEKVPLMCVGPDPVAEIREALKTGKPIECDAPPGAVI